MEIDNPPEIIAKEDELAAAELPAPPGWKKKIIPKKIGTPKRNEIVFISPTNEEIKTKKQLELYLKSHAGDYSMSEFDWSTVETPRRSARLSEKTKATECPENEIPKKKERKSDAEKEVRGKDDGDEGDQLADDNKDAAHESKSNVEETNLIAEVSSPDEGHSTESDHTQVVTSEIITVKNDEVEFKQNNVEDKIIAELLDADENMDANLQTDAAENSSKNQVENIGFRKSSDVKNGANKKSLPSMKPSVSEEVDSKPSKAELSEVVSVGHVEDDLQDSASKKDEAENTQEH